MAQSNRNTKPTTATYKWDLLDGRAIVLHPPIGYRYSRQEIEKIEKALGRKLEPSELRILQSPAPAPVEDNTIDVNILDEIPAYDTIQVNNDIHIYVL